VGNAAPLVDAELVDEVTLDGGGGEGLDHEIGRAEAARMTKDTGAVGADEEEIGHGDVVFVEDDVERPHPHDAQTAVVRKQLQPHGKRESNCLMGFGGRGTHHDHAVQQFVEDAVIGEITELGIGHPAPDERGHGIGASLLNHLLLACRNSTTASGEPPPGDARLRPLCNRRMINRAAAGDGR